MLDHREQFDIRGYPKEHLGFSYDNKKVVGKMKNELNGEAIRNLLTHLSTGEMTKPKDVKNTSKKLNSKIV